MLGPILGGVFTNVCTVLLRMETLLTWPLQGPSWRWCFYVNLPIGFTTIAIIAIFFKTPPRSRVARMPWKEIPFRFDIPGVLLILCALVCYLTVLQIGGLTKPWNSSEPIGLLIG